MAYDILVVDDEPGLREMVQGILVGAIPSAWRGRAPRRSTSVGRSCRTGFS